MEINGWKIAEQAALPRKSLRIGFFILMLPISRRSCVAALLALPVGAWAEGLASPRQVRFIVPYPAGGVVDALTRHLAVPLRQALGVDVTVENIPGAAGSLALRHLLASPISGGILSIAMGSDSDALLVPLVNPGVKFHSEDFRLIGLVGTATMMMVTRPDIRPASLSEIVSEARLTGARPITNANAGVDSNGHLMGEALSRRLGVELIAVPYKGSAAMVQDLMGGHVDVAFVPIAGGIPALVTQGKLKALAVAAAQRDALLPEVPTFAEAIGLQGFEFTSWSGVMVPRAMPEPVARWLNRALQRAMGDAHFRTVAALTGGTVALPMTLDEAATYFDRQRTVYQQLATTLRPASAPAR